MSKIRLAFIIVLLSILGGFCYHFLMDEEDGLLQEKPLSIRIPEDGVKTDGFGIRLFHAAMEQQPGESVLVCPAAVSDALLELRELAELPVAEQIDQLRISAPDITHTAVPDSALLIGTDFGLNYTETAGQSGIMRLPFKANLPLAISLFNGTLGQQTGISDEIIISSELLQRNTRFIVGLCTRFSPSMEFPFLAGNSIVSEFENANGSLPQVSMMRVRANVRYAADPEGEWEAVALLLQPNQAPEGVPMAFIGILPKRPAAQMAESLTAEQLSAIRKALAEAAPRDCCVSLPQMNWDATSQDLSPLLQKMALNSLFDITAKNWKIADQKLGVDAVAGKISIRLTPRQGEIGQQAKPENAAHSITFNKPFIWMISDLTTDAPAYYIGLVQNL